MEKVFSSDFDPAAADLHHGVQGPAQGVFKVVHLIKYR